MSERYKARYRQGFKTTRICKWRGSEFGAVRKDATFCGATCRKANQRHQAVIDKELAEGGFNPDGTLKPSTRKAIEHARTIIAPQRWNGTD